MTHNENNLIKPKNDYITDIVAILNKYINDGDESIKSLLSDYHDNDIAIALQCFDMDDRKKIFALLELEQVSDIFAYIDDPEEYIDELDTKTYAEILQNMEADEVVDILEELSDEDSNELLQLMDEDVQKDVKLIQSYDEDEVGSKMTTNYVTLTLGQTIRQAMKSLVKQAAENDNITTLYVLKEDDTFLGAVYLTDLIIARDYDDLNSLIVTSYPFVYAHELIDDCIEALKDYSEDSIPVLDENMHLLGVITSQDLLEVVDEEMGEDYAMLAGLSAEEELDEPLTQSIKKRIPWLTVLLFLGLLVSAVVGKFESLVRDLTIVASFQSVITGMSGNAGTQSLAVTIRILSDTNIGFKDKLTLVFKEAKIGLCNGFLIGLVSFIFTGLFIYLAKGQSLSFAFTISGCIGGALVLSMFISGLVGTLIPMGFEKINIDPAVASGPLITTINDLIAVVTYYGLVTLLVALTGLSA